MEIPWRQLSEAALDGLIQEFVLREGTDYGQMDFSLKAKVAQVRAQIEAGQVVILYDPYLESCTLERRR